MHQIIVFVVNTKLTYEHKDHLVCLVADLGHDFSTIVNSLLELLANIYHGQPVVLFKERNFDLQVHSEVELLLIRLIMKFLAHDLYHAILILLLHSLEPDLVEMVLFVHTISLNTSLFYIAFDWLI